MTAGSKQCGFTLIELMIGVAIVGILALLATPSFVDQIKRDRLVTTANQIQAAYRFARSEAVKREVTLQLKGGTSWQVVEVVNGNEVVLREFVNTYESLSIAFPSLEIRKTGELSATSNILITDNDNATTDLRFCALLSGQSWLESGDASCA